MQKGITPTTKEQQTALQALEVELGEPIEYRATGRFLGAEGLGTVPLDSWGLLVLTPTRLVFRHFAQAHPLFGGKGDEVRWEVLRGRFQTCDRVRQSFWNKLVSGTPDHISLTGEETRLALETADDQRLLPEAWNGATPLDPPTPKRS